MDTEGIADAQGTVTDPDGVVHAVQRHTRYLTVCGKSCAGWSRGLTQIQQMGLVSFCPDCEHQHRPGTFVVTAESDPDLFAGLREATLRAHRRELASQRDADEALLSREGWRTGTCSGCRTENELVKGPAEQQLCKYCDELRIMAPVQKPGQAARPAHGKAEKRLMTVAIVLLVSGIVTLVTGIRRMETSGMTFLVWGFLTALLAATWDSRRRS